MTIRRIGPTARGPAGRRGRIVSAAAAAAALCTGLGARAGLGGTGSGGGRTSA